MQSLKELILKIFVLQFEDEFGGCTIWYVWGMEEMHTGFWWGNLKERDL
jgi:hypothetical protein